MTVASACGVVALTGAPASSPAFSNKATETALQSKSFTTNSGSELSLVSRHQIFYAISSPKHYLAVASGFFRAVQGHRSQTTRRLDSDRRPLNNCIDLVVEFFQHAFILR